MNVNYRRRNKQPDFKVASDTRLFFHVLMVSLPTLLLLVYFLFNSDEPFLSKLVISLLVILWLLGVANQVRRRFLYHVRTLSTLVEAVRLEDFSFRSSRMREPGSVGELYQKLKKTVLNVPREI